MATFDARGSAVVVPTYHYDVFISYSHVNKLWVYEWLLPRLEAAGLQVCIDFRDFDIGASILDNMERAVEQSRHTLVVLTPSWVESEWAAFESLLTQTSDPAARRRRLLPLLKESCQPPRRISMIAYADFSDSQQWDQQLTRVIRAVKGELRLHELGPVLEELLPRHMLWSRVRAFAANHSYFLFSTIMIEGLLWAIYQRLKDLYLISAWSWIVIAALWIIVSWQWYIWARTRRLPQSWPVVLLLTALLIGTISWQGWAMVFPPRFAPQVFGIAVAELGEGAEFKRTPRTMEISGQVYKYLCDALNARFQGQAKYDACSSAKEDEIKASVTVRQIGVVANTQVARTHGQKIGADMVIWGQILTTADGRATISFQVLDTLDRSVDPEYPVVLPIKAISPAILARDLDTATDPTSLKRIVAQQSTIITAFTLGLVAYLDRNFPEAVNRLQTATETIEESQSLNISPEGRSLLYFYLGRANALMGRIDEGQAWLMQARDADPDEPAVAISLALGYASLGQVRERDEQLQVALDLVQKWLAIHPEDRAALYDRGLIYMIQRKHQAALLDFKAVVESDPTYYIAYLKLADAAVELRRYEEAIAALQDAIQLADRSGANPAWAHLNLALVREKAGQRQLVRNEYLKAISFDPEVDMMYYYYAQFLETEHEMDGAIEAYTRMIDVTYNKAWAHGKLAGFYRQRGLLQKAIEHYQISVHLQPEDGLIYAYMAETYLDVGDAEQAVAAFDAAIAHSNKVYYAYASYGNALYRLGQPEEAARMLEHSLELHPADSATLRNIGRIYKELGNTEAAQRTYCRILQSAPPFEAAAIQDAEAQLQSLSLSCP